MRVWLVRHAASTTPAEITVGAGDPPLSEEGRTQACGLAASLAGRPLAAVWSSDLTRATETASIIAARHGLPVLVTPTLRELDFGAWEGRDLRDLWREEPDAARAWDADIVDTPGSFGETVRDLEKRVRSFWEEQVVVVGEVAVVAHRGSLAALESVINGRPFGECFSSPSAWVEATERNLRTARSASRSRHRRAT